MCSIVHLLEKFLGSWKYVCAGCERLIGNWQLFLVVGGIGRGRGGKAIHFYNPKQVGYLFTTHMVSACLVESSSRGICLCGSEES